MPLTAIGRAKVRNGWPEQGTDTWWHDAGSEYTFLVVEGLAVLTSSPSPTSLLCPHSAGLFYDCHAEGRPKKSLPTLRCVIGVYLELAHS